MNLAVSNSQTSILKAGNERANAQADQTLKGVMDFMGFWS